MIVAAATGGSERGDLVRLEGGGGRRGEKEEVEEAKEKENKEEWKRRLPRSRGEWKR